MVDRYIKHLFILILIIISIPITYSATNVFGTSADFALLNVTLLSQEPDPVEPGEVVEIRFNVQNFGSKNAEDAQLDILPDFPFSMYTGTASKQIGTIYARQMGEKRSLNVYYKIKIGEDAIDGDNDLYVRFKYNEGITEGNWIKYFIPFKIRIRPREPMLFVDYVKTVPEQIAPGEKGIVDIKLKNMANSLMKNVKATLIIDSLSFVPLGSSNEKFVKQIDAKGEAILSFDLAPEASAEAKYYKIPLNLQYYVNGKTYNKTNYIGIDVSKIPDIYAQIESSTIYQAKKPGKITVKFVNKGSSNIKYLNAALKKTNDFEILSTEKVYVGNIDSDDYETGDFELYIKSIKKNIELPLQYTFLDANNREYIQDVKLILRLYSSSEVKKFGFVKSNNSGGLLIILIIVGTGIYFYLKKRKNKIKIQQ